MDVATHDGVTLEQANSGSAGSLAVIRAPFNPEWARLVIPAERSGGTIVPQLIFDTSGIPVTVTIQQPDSLLMVLDRISRTFGLTRKDLARVTNATRKTLYNWLDGKSAPRESSLQRLFVLAQLADDWTDADYTTDRTRIRKPIVDGQSVLDMLCEELLDSEMIVFAGTRLAMTEPVATLDSPFKT